MRLLVATTLVAGSLAAPALLSPGSAAADAPVHGVVLAGPSGAALPTWPTYADDVDRFSLRSAAGVEQLSVTASSSDPDATITVNGRPAGNGTPLVLQDPKAGDEVNVQITDAAGTSNQSWIVLPERFPDVRGTGPHDGISPGQVFVTLSSFVAPPFSAVLDDRGVPAIVLPGSANDFKQAGTDPDHFSIALPVEGGGERVVELDEQYREVASHRLAGDKAGATDFHDSTLFADGSSLLMGYDYVARDGGAYTDAIIQRLDPAGAPTWTWNSKDHVAASEGYVDRTAHDYAHINSLQELDNGDVLASFRNLSQVMLIAGSAHDGFDSGDVIWRLGGERNDFEIVDDPYGGPCAQHAARILPDGHLLIFDNGSRRDESGPIAPQSADMCPNPDDPDGARVARAQTRVTEYVLDTTVTPPTATLVWSHAPTGRYAAFAGNAQRLPNGNTLVGWSRAEVPAGTAPVATEVTPDDEEIWSLTGGGHFSYRAFRYPAPDRIPPEVVISSPTDGAVVEQGADLVADFGCSDTGGSNLDTCVASVGNGAPLTGTPGTHVLRVRATDLAGNVTEHEVTYTVTGAPQPTPPPSTTPVPTSPPAPTASTARADAMIRRPGGTWIGRDTYSDRRSQTLTVRPRPGASTTLRVRIRNAGDATARMRVSGSRGNRWITARWYAGKRDVTRRVRAGTYRTARLSSGESATLRLVVAGSPDGPGRRVTLELAAQARDTTPDVVRARVRTR